MKLKTEVIYLDNNATTKLAPEVLDAMLPFMRDFYGNASSMHLFGGQVANPINKARNEIAALLGCSAEEIYFTSGGTESDNTAIRGVLSKEKNHIITSAVEHPAIRSLCQQLIKEGYSVTEIGVDKDGKLN
jgi:cysteine desulfurase